MPMYQNDLAENFIKQTSQYGHYARLKEILEEQGYHLTTTKSSEIPSPNLGGIAMRDYCNTNSIVSSNHANGKVIVLTSAFDANGHKKQGRMEMWVGDRNIESLLKDALR